jgi:hypothetical protein
MAEIVYDLETRDRPALLIAMMRVLAGKTTTISFEGTLSQTELAGLQGVNHEEAGMLKRATHWPKLDFLVLPLTQDKIPAMEKAIISKIAFGEHGLIHVQIEQNGKMAFAAYDGFQHVVAFSTVPSALLDELTKTGVLHKYQESLQ